MPAHSAEIFNTPAEIGDVLAADILAGITAARADGKQFLLGCPSGRSPKPVYDAMAAKAAAANLDLSNLVLVMMDEYLGGGEDGLSLCPPDAHNSCRRFAEHDIRQRLNAGVEPAHQVDRKSVV